MQPACLVEQPKAGVVQVDVCAPQRPSEFASAQTVPGIVVLIDPSGVVKECE